MYVADRAVQNGCRKGQMPKDMVADGKRERVMDDNNFVTVAKEYLMELEQKAKDSEYFRGRIDGMEYVIDAIEEAYKSKESE